MLRPPHIRYSRIFVYHLDHPELQPIHDPDLIGAWREGETTVLFFHRANIARNGAGKQVRVVQQDLMAHLPQERLTILDRVTREKWGCWVLAQKQ